MSFRRASIISAVIRSRAWVQASSTLLYRSWSVMIPRWYSLLFLRTSFSASAMMWSLDTGVLRSSVANESPDRVDSRKPRSFIRSSSEMVSRRPRIW